MATVTLGLDLGISSIGWALVREEDSHELIAWGSRIFEPGMDDDIASGKGVSRCAVRRAKRALRVQYQRRRERKDELIAALITSGLLAEKPDDDFFNEIDQRLLKSFPKEKQRGIAHLIPYLYRKMALERPLQRDELGRAIFHLAQRRGYQSNRKQEVKDANSGAVKSGINALANAIRDSGARTLGEYFCTVDPETERIRSRYTDRWMYQDEFRKICQAQRALISETAEKELYRAIFYQRPLKSCKHLIGRCRVYQDLPRCSYAREEAQLFRIYTTVRNLRVEKSGVIRSLTETEYKVAISFLNSFSPLFKKNGKIALAKLQKEVGLGKGEKFTLGDEEKEIYGNELKNILFRAFGNKAEALPDSEKNKFFNDLASIKKEDVLRKRLAGYWNLSQEVVDDIAGVSMPDEYCSYSLKALRELLPDLEAGINLNTILKLNHSSSRTPVHDTLPILDDCDIELRNPVVHRVLTELRRVVNAIILRYGKPDQIKIELARDLKATNKEREKMTKQNREREKIRIAVAERIAKEVGIENPSRNDILKVMLAEECNFECPYSGTHLSMADLFRGLVEIEHIIPYSRSYDDSFANKTLCVREYNKRKNNRTPYEAFGGSSEYDMMLTRVSHFKGPAAERKLELFEMEEIKEQDFLNRNLNDTRYASKLAMQYLALLYGGTVDKDGRQRVFASSGGCTALVRRSWGGNYLLGEGEKVRDDHRHHAIDALTIAVTTPELIRKVAMLSPAERKKMREEMTFYDNALYSAAKAKLEEVAVTHHVLNKMRGELHQATLYSRNYDGVGEKHTRVALDELSVKDVENIVDESIQNIILQKLGVNDVKEVSDAMLKIFKEPANNPVMRDRAGAVVNVIKKVRVKQKRETRTIGRGDRQREVANGSNYILAIFAKLDDCGNEIAWTGEVVSLMDAVQRKQKGLPLFEKNKPGMKFKFSLQKGDIVSWEKDGVEQLCIIRGISLPQFSCVPVNDARMQKELKAAKMWFTPTVTAAFTGKMKKYNINIFGELQRAND